MGSLGAGTPLPRQSALALIRKESAKTFIPGAWEVNLPLFALEQRRIYVHHAVIHYLHPEGGGSFPAKHILSLPLNCPGRLLGGKALE